MTDKETMNAVYDMIIDSCDIEFPEMVFIGRELKPIPKKLKAFYCELTKLCKDYNVYIGSEDSQGSFEISTCYDDDEEHALKDYANQWLMDACVKGDFGE